MREDIRKSYLNEGKTVDKLKLYLMLEGQTEYEIKSMFPLRRDPNPC